MAKLRVSGEHIMNEARSLFYDEFNFNNAIDLLINSLQNDEMTDNEIKNLAIQILNGEAEIYDTDTGYDVRYLNPKDDKYDFYGMFSSCIKKQKDLEYKIESMINFIAGVTRNCPSYITEGINQEYYNLFGEKLWSEIARGFGRAGTAEENDYNEFYGQVGSPRWNQRCLDHFDFMNGKEPTVDASLLSPHVIDNKPLKKEKPITYHDYIDKNETNYGFITPDGEYIPVPFSHHEIFANLYTEKHYKTDYKIVQKKYITHQMSGAEQTVFCDYLVYTKGFILLDNPSGGKAFITRDVTKHMSSKQKDALYDYLIAHNRNKEAYELDSENLMASY